MSANLLLDLVFPPRCVGCGRLGRYICAHCHKTLVVRSDLCPECDRPAIDGFTHPRCIRSYGLDGLTTVFSNHGVMKKAIKVLKYRLVSDLAGSMINLIPEKCLASIKRQTWVVYPIPLHFQRLRWRGFNQTQLLAKFIAKRLNMELADGLLVRKLKRTPQAEIKSRDERIKNARGLFAISSKFKTRKMLNILLIDDVWTTGATMKEATKVLKRNAVKKVWGLTLAR